MGFFDSKKICSSCGNTVGLNRYSIKNDSCLCPACKKMYMKEFSPNKTFDQIDAEYKLNNKKLTIKSNEKINNDIIIELNSLEKLQFRKFISDQSGMSLLEVDSFLENQNDDEKNSLIDSFRYNLNTNKDKKDLSKIVTTKIKTNNPTCPKCKSDITTFNKQGYGVGKATIGVILTGGLGLIAGSIGKNKIIVTCLECGYSWKKG